MMDRALAPTSTTARRFIDDEQAPAAGEPLGDDDFLLIAPPLMEDTGAASDEVFTCSRSKKSRRLAAFAP